MGKNIENFRQVDLETLKVKSKNLGRDIVSLRVKSSVSHVKDYSLFKKTRRSLARVLTILREKGFEIGGQNGK